MLAVLAGIGVVACASAPEPDGESEETTEAVTAPQILKCYVAPGWYDYCSSDSNFCCGGCNHYCGGGSQCTQAAVSGFYCAPPDAGSDAHDGGDAGHD